MNEGILCPGIVFAFQREFLSSQRPPESTYNDNFKSFLQTNGEAVWSTGNHLVFPRSYYLYD